MKDLEPIFIEIIRYLQDHTELIENTKYEFSMKFHIKGKECISTETTLKTIPKINVPGF